LISKTFEPAFEPTQVLNPEPHKYKAGVVKTTS